MMGRALQHDVAQFVFLDRLIAGRGMRDGDLALHPVVWQAIWRLYH